MFGLSEFERTVLRNGYKVRANCTYHEAEAYIETRWPRKKWWQFWKKT